MNDDQSNQMDMEQLVYCLCELELLKTIERGQRVGQRKESTAEHSWSCMLLADILIDFVPEPLSRPNVLECLLYHDLVEIYAGDAKFNNPDDMMQKKRGNSERCNGSSRFSVSRSL